ncbi:MAG: hypothetical protein N2578_00095 [Bdellovibrionaceae bacterium]|nr:hypothetical protein [Pseudobdellovibrionaceae bacterium]
MMLLVGQLIKFISDQNHQNNLSYSALLNWLKYCHTPNTPLTCDVFESFFEQCLSHSHWQQHKVQLGKDIQALLLNFSSLFRQNSALMRCRLPQELQVISVENSRDFQDITENWLQNLAEDEDKCRVLLESNEESALGLILRKEGTLEVRRIDRKFTIRKGRITPLRQDLCLVYNSRLELSEDQDQMMEIAPGALARFRVSGRRLYGVILRGFAFQNVGEMHGEEFNESSRLFYPLKRIEQYFVDRRTDNFYQEIVSLIERARALIAAGDQEALAVSSTIIGRAETARELVYTDDRYLELLIRDLRSVSSAAQSKVRNLESDLCPKIHPRQPSALTN